MMSSPARRAFAGASAAALGVAIGQGVDFPHSHWAVITVLTLLRPGPESTGGRTLLRILGTVVGALLVVGVYGLADPQPRWIIPAAVGLIGLCYTLMQYTQSRYALVLLCVTASGFGLESLDDPLGAPSLVGYRVFHIVVASVLVFIMTTLLRYQDAGQAVTQSTTPTDAVDHGLRTMLACLLGLALCAVLEKPGFGGPVIITVCVLGARTDFTQALDVGIQRLVGALFGGVLSLAFFVFLLDYATGILSLMVVVFVAAWLCLVLIGIPSISYLVFQTGFVFAWSIGDLRTPAGDVWIPLDRMAQVALGGGLLLLTYLLPPRRGRSGEALPTRFGVSFSARTPDPPAGIA